MCISPYLGAIAQNTYIGEPIYKKSKILWPLAFGLRPEARGPRSRRGCHSSEVPIVSVVVAGCGLVVAGCRLGTASWVAGSGSGCDLVVAGSVAGCGLVVAGSVAGCGLGAAGCGLGAASWSWLAVWPAAAWARPAGSPALCPAVTWSWPAAGWPWPAVWPAATWSWPATGWPCMAIRAREAIRWPVRARVAKAAWPGQHGRSKALCRCLQNLW